MIPQLCFHKIMAKSCSLHRAFRESHTFSSSPFSHVVDVFKPLRLFLLLFCIWAASFPPLLPKRPRTLEQQPAPPPPPSQPEQRWKQEKEEESGMGAQNPPSFPFHSDVERALPPSSPVLGASDTINTTTGKWRYNEISFLH